MRRTRKKLQKVANVRPGHKLVESQCPIMGEKTEEEEEDEHMCQDWRSHEMET